MENSKFKVSLFFEGINIHIHSNSQQLFDMAVEYFHNCDDGRRNIIDKRIDFYFEQRKTLSRGRWDLANWKNQTYIFESWSRDITARSNYQKGIIRSYLSSQCKFPREVIEDLLIFRPLRLMLGKYGFPIIHAGCVAIGDWGILIPSIYGRGKTITTLNLVRKGFKFLSDEYVLLKESNGKIEAHPLPQRIGIRKDLMNLFPELKFLRDRKDSFHRKKRFWIEEAYPKAAAKACYPRLIIFPNFKKNCKLDLAKISKKEALLNILKDKESFAISMGILKHRDSALRHFNILSSLIEQTDTYQLTYSGNNLDNLAEMLKNPRLPFKR